MSILPRKKLTLPTGKLKLIYKTQVSSSKWVHMQNTKWTIHRPSALRREKLPTAVQAQKWFNV